MEKTNNIKIVRLHSGEDIIANYHIDKANNLVMLDKPMHVIFKRLPNEKTVMMMMPWLPLELISENNALLNGTDILTTIEPRKELISYYLQASLNSDLLIEDEDVGISLLSPFEDEIEEEDEDDEFSKMDEEEVMELFKERKKSKLH
jgi:hypothetical protein